MPPIATVALVCAVILTVGFIYWFESERAARRDAQSTAQMNTGEKKPPWFRERLFGTGYGPYSWQGWLVTVVFLALFIGTGKLAEYLIPLYHLSYGWWFIFALWAVYLTAFLRILHTHKGPW
jgi:hypothetical protein